MGPSEKVKLLEAEALKQAKLARESAEKARDVVVESAGRMIDEARENPELEINEDHEAVQALAKKTGRSGDRYRAASPRAEEKR